MAKRSRNENGKIQLFILLYLMKSKESCKIKDIYPEIVNRFKVSLSDVKRHFRKLKNDNLIIFDQEQKKYTVPTYCKNIRYFEEIGDKIKIRDKDLISVFIQNLPINASLKKDVSKLFIEYKPTNLRKRDRDNAVDDTMDLLNSYGQYTGLKSAFSYPDLYVRILERRGLTPKDIEYKTAKKLGEALKKDIELHEKEIEIKLKSVKSHLSVKTIPKYEHVFIRRILDFVNIDYKKARKTPSQWLKNQMEIQSEIQSMIKKEITEHQDKVSELEKQFSIE